MTKKILIIFIVLIALQGQFCMAKVFNSNTQPFQNTNDVPDPLTQYNGVEDQAKGILSKITGEWKKINDWGTNLWAKNFNTSFLGKYAIQLKENIKQGWEEEKQEYRQDFFKALGTLWEKIKNKLFHR